MEEKENYAYPFNDKEIRNIRSTIKPLPAGIKKSVIEKEGKYYIDLELLCEFLRTGAIYPEKYIKKLREDAPKSIQLIFKGSAFWAMTLHVAFDKLLSEMEYERSVKGVNEK